MDWRRCKSTGKLECASAGSLIPKPDGYTFIAPTERLRYWRIHCQSLAIRNCLALCWICGRSGNPTSDRSVEMSFPFQPKSKVETAQAEIYERLCRARAY